MLHDHPLLTIFSELTVKIVNVDDMTNVKYLREQTKGSKHVSFDPSGQFVAVSCTDGVLYIYSLVPDEPELVRKIDGAIRRLEPEDEATSRVVWHPDGTAFATAQATREIAIFSTSDWSRQQKTSFMGSHNGDITALGWSANGAMLATAAADGQILLWETATQNILKRYSFANVINLAWHPNPGVNLLCFTTSDGEVYIHENFVPKEYQPILEKRLESFSVRSAGPLGETSGNARKQQSIPNRSKTGTETRRGGSPDSLDDILGSVGGDEDEDDFVEDDDGAGYAEDDINAHGKRTNGHLGGPQGRDQKRLASSHWETTAHESFQPGSTPWKGNRRYLGMIVHMS